MTHRSVFPTLPFQTKWVRIILRAARYTIRPSTRIRVPLNSAPSQFNTWVQHKDHIFSAPKIPEFNTKKPLSSTRKTPQSTPKTPQFNTSLNSTPKTPQFNTVFFGVELRVFWCWTEGFWVLKRYGPCVELKGSVWNWREFKKIDDILKIYLKKIDIILKI